MFSRILKTLIVAVAAGILFPVQAAIAKPVGDDALPAGVVVTSKPRPIVSEKAAGLYQGKQWSVPAGVNMTQAEYRALMLRSQALNDRYGLGQALPSSRVVSEKTTGLVQPFSSTPTQVVVSTDNGFDWGDAGIGAGVVAGTMLLGAAGVISVRRHRGTLAQ
jgi:hypothetical protein